MKAATIERIRRLLHEDVQARISEKKMLEKLIENAKKRGGEHLEALHRICDSGAEERMEALAALEDFENAEWEM